MALLEFLRPNREKLLITFFGYGMFYVFDILILSRVEEFYIFSVTQQILSNPISYWILRFFYEIIIFYIIASFAYWFLHLKNSYKV